MTTSFDTPERSTPISPLTDLEMTYLAVLEPSLEKYPDPPEAIRGILGLAAKAGVDWSKLYQIALSLRPEDWEPAPSLQEVAPT